jgi:hypothetical protein
MFNIRFVTPSGAPIKGMIEIPDSFIESFNVTRSPTRGIFQLTKDHWPFGYKLEIVFKEMQMLTRDDMKYLRQSDEQAAALYSGNAIPSEWDPNNTKISGDISGILGQIPPPTTDTEDNTDPEDPNPLEQGANSANPDNKKNYAKGAPIEIKHDKPVSMFTLGGKYTRAQIEKFGKDMTYPDGSKILNGYGVPQNPGYVYIDGKIVGSNDPYVDQVVIKDGKLTHVKARNPLRPLAAQPSDANLTPEQKAKRNAILETPVVGKENFEATVRTDLNLYWNNPQFAMLFAGLKDCKIKGKIPDSYASQYAGNIWAQMKRAGQGKYDSRQKTNTGKTAETIIKEFIIEKIHARNASCKV